MIAASKVRSHAFFLLNPFRHRSRASILLPVRSARFSILPRICPAALPSCSAYVRQPFSPAPRMSGRSSRPPPASPGSRPHWPGWWKAFFPPFPVQVPGCSSVAENAADIGGSQYPADVIRDDIPQTAVAGAGDGACRYGVPHGNMMPPQKFPFLRYSLRHSRILPVSENFRHHFPVAVLRMPVEKTGLSGFHRGKAPQHQNSGILIIEWRNGMHLMLRLHGFCLHFGSSSSNSTTT